MTYLLTVSRDMFLPQEKGYSKFGYTYSEALVAK